MNADQVFAKCAWRLVPFVVAGYAVNYLDRTNLGFAALTMNRDLGFSPSVYGLGAGIFFVSYSLFQIPANLMQHRLGARFWIFCILACWGAAAAANALIRDARSFYALRFLLGAAEAGFFPGIILYLSFWFPKAWIGRMTAMFMAATPASLVIGGPLASLILRLDGLAGIRGWQWLFLLEGLPACLLGIAVLIWLPDRPAQAAWLTEDERQVIEARLAAERSVKDQDILRALCDTRVLLLGLGGGGILIAIYGFSFWLPLIVQGMGFSNTVTGLVTALLYLLPVPAMILWARSSDRRNDRIWHLASAALFAASALALASALQSSLLVLLALGSAAIGMYSALPLGNTLVPSFLSGAALASGFALMNMISNLLGGFAGQYLIGLIREKTGSYVPALVLIATALVVYATIVLLLGRSIQPRRTAMLKPST